MEIYKESKKKKIHFSSKFQLTRIQKKKTWNFQTFEQTKTFVAVFRIWLHERGRDWGQFW